MEIETTTGRVFTAEVDPTSGTKQLWLRTARNGMYLYRPIQWSAVAEVRDGATKYTGAEFRQAIENRRWPTTGDPFIDAPADRPRAPKRPSAIPQVSPTEPRIEEVPALPVRSLHIEVTIANWNANVDVDGLVVRVMPLDAYGNIVPVLGTFEMELIGRRRTLQTRDEPFPPMGRWSNLLSPEDFGPNGAVVQLPFQALHPEYEPDIARLAVAHGRLTVAGAGVFEDSNGLVQIRPYSSPRDALQQTRGYRFFPNEMTGRGVWNTNPTP